jgi:hypothetical protein
LRCAWLACYRVTIVNIVVVVVSVVSVLSDTIVWITVELALYL